MKTTIGLFRPGTSLLHRAPAGLKLAGLVSAAVATHWLGTPVRVGLAAVTVVILHALAGIPLRVALSQLRPLLWIAAVLAVFQALVSGWRTAVVVVGLLVLLAALASLVTLTTRTTQMIDAVVRLVRPLRYAGIDPERVGLLLSLGIRSVAVVAGLAGQVREAQLARGLSASPTAFAVPLVVRALRHADALGEALVARGVDD